MDNRRIEIVIPTWNRYQMTINSFKNVIDDERVASVCVTDDCSTDGSYRKLLDYFHKDNGWALSKVKLFRNDKNLDCYFNKHQAALNSSYSWIAIWDSDNIFDKSYIDVLYSIPEWDEKTIYAPSFLKPAFDFRKWSGLTLTKENVAQYADTDLMTSLNAFNFFINREEYLKVWDGGVNPLSSDSIYFSYCWLKAGNKIHITPNLEYFHTLHADGSGHFTQNQHKTVRFHEDLMNKIRNLK